MGKIAALQAAEQGSTPCGATANSMIAKTFIEKRSKSFAIMEKHTRWHVTAELPRSCGEKEIMPAYGSGGGGSSPSGSASRSASSMGERAVYTREMTDSFAEHGGRSSTGQSAGP